MQLLLNLEKDGVGDLVKAIKILEKVISNKENGAVFSEGLEEFQEQVEKSDLPDWLMKEEENRKTQPVEEEPVNSMAAEKIEEQKKMMEEVNLSEILRNKK
tara:strand:- start:1343 stop:1645 length:303 start_codon:yes stop_codon:yes gene_type:complete